MITLEVYRATIGAFVVRAARNSLRKYAEEKIL